MTDPTEQALPFSEAAREAAARSLAAGFGYEQVFDGGWLEPYDANYWRHLAAKSLTTAVNADPRLAAFLKLAALSDEELVERAKAAIDKNTGPGALLDDELHFFAATVLAALGLPVAEQEGP